MIIRLSGLVLALVLTSCQATPTRVAEVQQREYYLLVDKAAKPLVLDERMAVLDARSSFDYGLNRVGNSRHFPWENLAENAGTGEVLRDKRKAAQRLALNGLRPMTPVVVVGYGLNGKGEEGRLAWNLVYLGFQDVQVGSIDLFRRNLTQAESPAPINAESWTANLRDRMEISKADFSTLAKTADRPAVIIDVRSAEEHSSSGKEIPKGVLNIEWKEFYTSLGRPNPIIRKSLEAIGVKPDIHVILVSNKGVRSGAAAYALMALGYTNVQNFTGGWNSFLKK